MVFCLDPHIEPMATYCQAEISAVTQDAEM